MLTISYPFDRVCGEVHCCHWFTMWCLISCSPAATKPPRPSQLLIRLPVVALPDRVLHREQEQPLALTFLAPLLLLQALRVVRCRVPLSLASEVLEVWAPETWTRSPEECTLVVIMVALVVVLVVVLVLVVGTARTVATLSVRTTRCLIPTEGSAAVMVEVMVVVALGQVPVGVATAVCPSRALTRSDQSWAPTRTLVVVEWGMSEWTVAADPSQEPSRVDCRGEEVWAEVVGLVAECLESPSRTISSLLGGKKIQIRQWG